MSERHVRAIPVVFFILMRQGRALLQLRQNTGYADGLWCIPGGHAEKGEHILTTLKREAKEELGVSLDTERAQLIALHHCERPDQDAPGLNLYYKITEWEGEPTNHEAERASALQWFPLNELPSNVHPEAATILTNASLNKFIHTPRSLK